MPGIQEVLNKYFLNKLTNQSYVTLENVIQEIQPSRNRLE